MSLEEANELAARIREQFPHVTTAVVQSADMRNAPINWFVAVEREGLSLDIHTGLEWIRALEALHVLGK